MSAKARQILPGPGARAPLALKVFFYPLRSRTQCVVLKHSRGCAFRVFQSLTNIVGVGPDLSGPRRAVPRQVRAHPNLTSGRPGQGGFGLSTELRTCFWTPESRKRRHRHPLPEGFPSSPDSLDYFDDSRATEPRLPGSRTVRVESENIMIQCQHPDGPRRGRSRTCRTGCAWHRTQKPGSWVVSIPVLSISWNTCCAVLKAVLAEGTRSR